MKTIDFTVRMPKVDGVSQKQMRTFIDEALRTASNGKRPVAKSLAPVAAAASRAKVVRTYAKRDAE